ncbi:ribonuclease CL2-like [Sylvia atricapilla]|uniref:ribonuclease CL2-like n=1 Tax=Sylvia atricapilla TaxID=48155 RepID=UPI00339362B7
MASWVLCMILLLAALPEALGETRYGKFQRQHVDNPRTSVRPALRYCDTMMMRRQMAGPTVPCKFRNTFVHTPAGDLVAACYRTPNNDGTYSTSYAMSITVCTRNGGAAWPCNYRIRQARHYVRVNCEYGRPVHLNSTATTP